MDSRIFNNIEIATVSIALKTNGGGKKIDKRKEGHLKEN